MSRPENSAPADTADGRKPRWAMLATAGFWFFLLKGLAWLIVPVALAWFSNSD